MPSFARGTSGASSRKEDSRQADRDSSGRKRRSKAGLNRFSDKEADLASRKSAIGRSSPSGSRCPREEAKKLIIQGLENEARRDAGHRQQDRAGSPAYGRAQVPTSWVTTIQRIATEVTTEVTVTSSACPRTMR